MGRRAVSGRAASVNIVALLSAPAEAAARGSRCGPGLRATARRWRSGLPGDGHPSGSRAGTGGAVRYQVEVDLYGTAPVTMEALVVVVMGKRQSRPWIVSDELWSLIEPLLPAGAEAGGGTASRARPAGPGRDPVCPAPRHPVGVPAPRARLRFGHDLLAAPGGLERGRRLGPVAPTAAEQAALEERAGLVAGGDRLLPRPGRTEGPESGPSPVDRARPGSKHHIITDGQGIPLAVSLTGQNRNDVTQLLP